MRLRLRLSALLLAVLICFSGCAVSSKSEASASAVTEPVYSWGNVSGKTITVWGDKDDLKRSYIVRAFERYEEMTGNVIEAVPLSKKDKDEMLPQVFASETAQKPDLLLSHGGTNIERLKPDENFYDFTNAPWVDDLTDIAINQTIFNGRVVGLPHGEASVSGMLYNKEIFKKYNLQIPKTQDEFLEVCEVLLKNGITPVYLPYAEITMLLYQFPMDSIFKDREVLSKLNNGELSYSQIPEMKKVVQWYKTMSDKGYFGKDYINNNWDGMDNAMKSDKYAMMLCWDTWIYTSFTGDPAKLGLMPAFIGTPYEGCFEGANIVMFLANRKSPQLDASLDLISFLADPYNYNYAFEGIYTAPAFKRQTGSYATPEYMEADSLIDSLFYDSTASLRVRGFSQIDATYIQDFMQGKTSLEQCLRLMDEARIKRAGKTSSDVN